jgi:hypothetical protein
VTDPSNWLEAATVLAGPTDVELDPGEPADLVLLEDGRIGYATARAFRAVGDDDDLQEIGVNTGSARGTSVLSLVFGSGEVRETVGESGAVVSKRLRTEGYAVSARTLDEPGPPPPVGPIERLDEDGGFAQPGARDLGAARYQDLADEETAGDEIVATGTAQTVSLRPAGAPQSDAAPVGTPAPVDASGPAARTGRLAALLGRGVVALLRSLVLLAGLVVVAILVIYVVLVLTKANPHNDLTRFFARAARPLAWKFKDLFTPRTRRANITENYGLAAVVYLALTLFVARVLARLAPAKPVR